MGGGGAVRGLSQILDLGREQWQVAVRVGGG